MADAPSNSNPSNPDPGGGGAGGGNTPPANPQGGANNAPAAPDLKTLDADQLQAVLENPNLWNLPRVKELREQAAEAKRLKEAQDKANEDSLAEQKKFEELANQRGEKLTEYEQKFQNMQIDQALTNKLVPEGVVDLEAALKLADRSKIKVAEDGSITGVDEALATLKEGKAYLFGKPGQPKVGGPTNPDNQPSGPAKFKRSQLRDTAFYAEHRDEILAAQKAGQIEDDISAPAR